MTEFQNSKRLIVFIGPSGSGKDTLMVKSRDILLSEDLNVHIVQRWITRPNDDTEQFKSVTKEQFNKAIEENTFSLYWEIYGNYYGVPRSEIDPYLEKENFIVLVNLSRKELSIVKKIYPKCKIVLVDVSPKLARERIINRKRDSGEFLEARLKRLHQSIELTLIPDLIIKNDGKLNASLYVVVEFLKALIY